MKNKGITLIALVVTIVVLLILAGVSISTLIGENGIITQAQKSKEQTEIGREKEYISLAVADIKSNQNDINRDNLQEALDKIAGINETYVNGNERLTIIYTKSKRIYYLNINGNIVEEKEDENNIYKYTTDGYITGIQSEYIETVPGIEGAVLYKIKDDVGTKLEIPKEIDNTIIIGISEGAFRSLVNLEEIIIPESVIEISNAAFQECYVLKTIELSHNIEKIGDNAFSWCESLLNIEIPLNIKSIGDNAFAYCSNINITTLKLPDTLNYLGRDAFYKCSKIKNLEIGKGVKEIESRCFAECESLETVNIPGNIETIKGMAFYACENLTTVNLSSGLKEIENGAFSNCSKLSNINIPDTVEKIEEEPFYGTIFEANFPNGEVYLGKVLYEYKGSMPSNTSISIKEGTTQIAGYIFEDCTNLVSVYIPDSVKIIGNSAFSGCTKLTSVKMSNSIEQLGQFAFYNCYNIEEIYFPKTLTTVGKSVFMNWQSDQKIYFAGEKPLEGWVSNWNAGCNAVINFKYV